MRANKKSKQAGRPIFDHWDMLVKIPSCLMIGNGAQLLEVLFSAPPFENNNREEPPITYKLI